MEYEKQENKYKQILKANEKVLALLSATSRQNTRNLRFFDTGPTISTTMMLARMTMNPLMVMVMRRAMTPTTMMLLLVAIMILILVTAILAIITATTMKTRVDTEKFPAMKKAAMRLSGAFETATMRVWTSTATLGMNRSG